MTTPTGNDTDGAAAPWLLFVMSLQGPQQAARVRLWRGLRSLGAGVLRDGVHLLPHRDDLIGALDALAADAVRSDGTARILTVSPRDDAQAAEFRALFDRTAEYEPIVQEIAGVPAELAANPDLDADVRLGRLRRDFEAVVARDYFPGEAQRQAARALDDLAAALRDAAGGEPHARRGQLRRLDASDYRGRTWATRRRPWADRLGSAWLIRRFIDPEARFAWLEKPPVRSRTMVGFDFDGATFTHVDGRVTFEVLMESFGLGDDAALRAVADVVHFMDVGGIAPPIAAGFEALLGAARATFADDDTLFDEAAKLFELLYRSAGA